MDDFQSYTRSNCGPGIRSPRGFSNVNFYSSCTTKSNICIYFYIRTNIVYGESKRKNHTLSLEFPEIESLIDEVRFIIFDSTLEFRLIESPIADLRFMIF